MLSLIIIVILVKKGEGDLIHSNDHKHIQSVYVPYDLFLSPSGGNDTVTSGSFLENSGKVRVEKYSTL